MTTLKSWVTDLEDATKEQAEKATRLPIVWPHVALMPDAHVGIGATVGSVIPCDGAVIPSAVGVDLGCGMIAVQTNLKATDLPDSLEALLPEIEYAIPAGVGMGHSHKEGTSLAQDWFKTHTPTDRMTADMTNRAVKQFGSLGSGNHFFEICLDETDTVWVVLHSGSRGIGNQLATLHIEKAKQLNGAGLEDPDLAWLVQGTQQFAEYIEDMLWAQQYAYGNREAMMHAALLKLFAYVGQGKEVDRINCHHNFCQQEHHFGRDLWVTRKGAIQADAGRRGVIPGSMGTRSYIVEGLGNADSFNSSSHGAGRRFSRSKARKTFTEADLATAMEGKTWLKGKAKELLDEIPGAYKDIDEVMEAQKDLTRPLHTLRQILNYKGA